MHELAQSPFLAWPLTLAEHQTRGQRHVSDTSISTDDMAFHQKRGAEADIKELIFQCRDRYCFALELIKPHASYPERLTE